MLLGELITTRKDAALFDQGSSQKTPCYHFAVMGSWPLYKKFRIGVELGQNTFKYFFNYDILNENGQTSRYNGLYRIKQYHLVAVPEFRLNEWIFLNAGLGIYLDAQSQFRYGSRSVGEVSVENLAGTSFKRGWPVGGFVGAGICPNITDELSLFAEVRLTGCPVSVKSGSQIAASYTSKSYNLGLLFKLRESKK